MRRTSAFRRALLCGGVVLGAVASGMYVEPWAAVAFVAGVMYGVTMAPDFPEDRP